MMPDTQRAAERLYDLLRMRFWDGAALRGPDQGVRFNRRAGRFVKSYLPFLPWRDNYYYLQAQSYWALDNWLLYDLTGDHIHATAALQCSGTMLHTQSPAGHWPYPHPAWGGKVATVELATAGLGLLESYAHSGDSLFLDGAIKVYRYLVERVGFLPGPEGLAIKYFAGDSPGLVPNNATLALAFFGRLAALAADARYREFCAPLLAFLRAVQLPDGELPYLLAGTPDGADRVHFQCFQYHAFQLQDLAVYFDATHDSAALPLITAIARFLEDGVTPGGAARYDCHDHRAVYPYHTAAVAAALGIARHMGLHDAAGAEERAYRFVLSQQRRDGGFAFSAGDYGFLADRRYYPRPLSMILYHLLLKTVDFQVFTPAIQGELT